MQSSSLIKDQTPIETPKIYFSSKTFGKPTKNRAEDPTMFELLAWPNSSSLEASDFKKKEHFADPKSAYLNMISKNLWISQSQQNYLNFHKNSLQVNQNVFRQVENYIQCHQSKKKKEKQNVCKPDSKLIQKSNNQNSQKKDFTVQQLQQKKQQKKSGQSQFSKSINKGEQRQNACHQQKNIKKRAKSNLNLNLSKKTQSKNSGFYESGQQKQNKQSKVSKNDDLSEEEQQKLIHNFKQTTRWIPNSSFTTYFGKPPFENYGRGNTKPIDGGLIYGTYLYSHNVFPHRGTNLPNYVQSYPVALMKAKSTGRLIPTQPKTPCKYLENKVKNQRERQFKGFGAIEAQKNTFKPLQIEVPDLHRVQKFSGTKLISSKNQFYTQSKQFQNIDNEKVSAKKF